MTVASICGGVLPPTVLLKKKKTQASGCSFGSVVWQIIAHSADSQWQTYAFIGAWAKKHEKGKGTWLVVPKVPENPKQTFDKLSRNTTFQITVPQCNPQTLL